MNAGILSAMAEEEAAFGAPRGDLPFTDADFARIAAFAHREFGLNLVLSKKDLVYSRLLKRLRQTGCPDFATYVARLESEGEGEERRALITALTTNVTHFFREQHHFRLLSEHVIRPSIDSLRAGRRLRLWSAGCSAGQEPYSMAMTVLHDLPEAARLNVRILATDIDPAILERAQAAEYPAEERNSIPEPYRPLLAEGGPAATAARSGAGGGPARPAERFRIPPQVGGLIRFAELNLMRDWPMRGPFDAIFCRNVAIYFDKPTQARLWQRLAGLLAPGGLLCIGHSERLDGPAADLMTSVGITAYRRKPTAPADRAALPRKDETG
jgi:chemotaxis protein methyltransferase CheR